MALFNDVFNRASIYETLFFNIKAVLIHPTLADLQEKNPKLFKRWQYISKSKFNQEVVDAKPLKSIITNQEDSLQLIQNNVYEEKAIYYPEFCKIVAITYASLESVDGKLKRYFKKIVNQDEYLVIATFIDVLHQLSSEAVKSTPQYFPTLCGHNIMNYDIPLLIKRFIVYRDKFDTNKKLPLIIKNALNAKPWESGVIDTVNVWKFNGSDYTPLMLIADFMELKKTVDLEALPDMSRQYWELIADKPDEALEYIALQSATQTNLVIQLMNELRLL